MRAVKLETWEFAYNETHNELRLLVNSGSNKDSVLFSIAPENVYAVMEALESPDNESLELVGQPMKPEMMLVLTMEDPYEVDSTLEYAYRIQNDDVSEGFNGEKQSFKLYFEDQQGQRMFASTFFDEPSLEHLTLQADMETDNAV